MESNLNKKLSRIQEDLHLYLKCMNDNDRLDAKNIFEITSQLKSVILDLNAWIDDGVVKELSPLGELSCIPDYIRMLRSELSLASEWAVWNRNKESLTFLQIYTKAGSPMVQNEVKLEFCSTTSREWVVFFCTPSFLGTKLRFKVRPYFLLEHVIALLRSFQLSIVVAKKVTSTAKVGNIPRVSESMVDKNKDGRSESEDICENVKVEEGVSASDDDHESSDQSISDLSLD